MTSEVITIDSFKSILPATRRLLDAGGLAIHWKGAFSPGELLDVNDIPVPNSNIKDEQGYTHNILDIDGFPYNSSVIPVAGELVLPPTVAFAIYAVHMLSAGPNSNRMKPGSVPTYPRNPIGPKTRHTSFESRDMRPHYDGPPRSNGGLTFHATISGEFTAEFGRQDYGGIMPTRGDGWDEAQTIRELDFPYYSGEIEGGPGDVFIFGGYGLPHAGLYPVTHKFTSNNTDERLSSVFDPLSSVSAEHVPHLNNSLEQLVEFNSEFALYPIWDELLAAA